VTSVLSVCSRVCRRTMLGERDVVVLLGALFEFFAVLLLCVGSKVGREQRKQEKLHTSDMMTLAASARAASACINLHSMGRNIRMSRNVFDGKSSESIRIEKLQCLNAHVIRCALVIPLKHLPNTCASSKAPKQPLVVLQIYSAYTWPNT
jgi:hypothetical protein